MNNKKVDFIINKADEFGTIAKKVNESSKKRKVHAQNAKKLLNKSYEIWKKLSDDINLLSKLDIKQRDKDNIVSTTCDVLVDNVGEQKRLLSKLKSDKEVDKKLISQISKHITDFTKILKETLSLIQNIVESDNKIVLLDDILVMRKKFQQDSTKNLLKLTDKSIDEAQKAIEGSSSNLKRGLSMVNKISDIPKFIEKGNLKNIKTLSDEANLGWKIAEKVNKSSKVQVEFAERVNYFTKELHDDSVAIKEKIGDKHDIFEQNLQNITVLTVYLSVKFKKYLDIEKIVDKLKCERKNVDYLNNLKAYVKIACKDIKNISVLNYDMTDTTLINNETENKIIDVTKIEINCYNNIKKEVEDMTAATRYPMEGSNKNITNGKVLEKSLKEIMR